MHRFGIRGPLPGDEDLALVARELLRLDPWSFWSAELDDRADAAFAVVGRTGAFAVGVCALEGYLIADGRRRSSGRGMAVAPSRREAGPGTSG